MSSKTKIVKKKINVNHCKRILCRLRNSTMYARLRNHSVFNSLRYGVKSLPLIATVQRTFIFVLEKTINIISTCIVSMYLWYTITRQKYANIMGAWFDFY